MNFCNPLVILCFLVVLFSHEENLVVFCQSTPLNFSAPGVALQYLINSSYSTSSSSTNPNCPSLAENQCNLTTLCYFNWTLQTCNNRISADYGPGALTNVTSSWCFNYFSTPFISIVYFLGAFVGGFCGSGVVYSALYYDVYDRIDESGQRQHNRHYYSTSPIVIYCLVTVLASGLMALTSWINWNDETSCLYVTCVYIFLFFVILPLVYYPGKWAIVWLVEYVKGRNKPPFDKDEFLHPTTDEAMLDPLSCQMRSF